MNPVETISHTIFVRHLNMKKLLILFLTLLTAAPAFSQSLAQRDPTLIAAFRKLKDARNDNERMSASDSLRMHLMAGLDDPAAFEHPFTGLDISRITSSDQRVRIINWNVPLDDGTFRYYAFVLIRDAGKTTFTWTELIDNPRETEKPDTKFLNADKWMGALYYEIIPVTGKKRKPTDTYVLLGWDGKDNLTTRKVIDAITIQGNGKVRLGAAMFEMSTGTRKRIILEYSEEVSASVKYYPRKQCIVVDHLSPRNPMMEGVYSEYGPDGTYDLFQLEKGKWKLYENIDVSRFAESDDRPYSAPRRRR